MTSAACLPSGMLTVGVIVTDAQPSWPVRTSVRLCAHE
jgi:hypothetical protein